MEKQRWEESEKRREEERRSEKRKSEKKEDAGAREGRKVTIHSVFPMIRHILLLSYADKAGSRLQDEPLGLTAALSWTLWSTLQR